jgi:DNA-binding transcriptional ArsR family regulator
MSAAESDDQLDLVFAALADPTRRAIISRLSKGDAMIGDLVAPSGFSQPTVSQHVKVLERAGLVSRGRVAQFRPVHLEAVPLAKAVGWLEVYRQFWEGTLERVETYVDELKQQRATRADK